MIRVHLKSGLRFKLKNQIYKILKVFPENDIEAESENFHDTTIFKEIDLLKALETGELVFETSGKYSKNLDHINETSQEFNDLVSVNSKNIEKAKFRLKVIEPLVKFSFRTLKEVSDRVIEINSEIENPEALKKTLGCTYVAPITISTVYNWIKAYESSGGDNLSLIPSYHKSGGKNKLRFSSDVEECIQSIISKCYLTGQKLDVKDIHDIVDSRLKESAAITGQMMRCPSYQTICRMVRQIPEAELVLKRIGKRQANDKFKMVCQGPKVEIPLERVEMDHTELPLLIIDEIDWMPIGKPYLTGATDKATSNLLGFCISFKSPSYSTVMQCLKHVLTEKSYVKEKYPLVQNQWNAYGVPTTIVVDNGPEFHSDAFKDACFQLGFVLEYAPTRTPEWKGSIERYFGTFKSSFTKKLPGTTQSDIKKQGDLDPTKEACIPMSVFLELVHIWIIDIYNQEVNKGAGGIPAKLWECKTALYPPAWPDSTHELPILLGNIAYRRIRNKGIELEGLYYNSVELNKLLCSFSYADNGYNDHFKIKWDPLNISSLYVYDHINKLAWIKVPAVDQEYTYQLSQWEHKIYRKIARERFQVVNIESLMAAKKIVRDYSNEWYDKVHGKSRAKLAQIKNIGSDVEIFSDPWQVNPEVPNNDDNIISDLGFLPDIPEIPLTNITSSSNNNLKKKQKTNITSSVSKSPKRNDNNIQAFDVTLLEKSINVTFDFDKTWE